jgi:SAM-dependent methyltransferase
MNRAYWDALAENYEEEVFSVLENDSANTIRWHIKNHTGANKIATDLGCGIGYILPLLSRYFDRVEAVDLSAKCLKRARSSNENLDNVRYWHLDMSREQKKLPRSDFMLAVNSVISPSLQVQRGLFRSIKQKLKKGGELLLVVPSLESSLFVDNRNMEIKYKENKKSTIRMNKGFNKNEYKKVHEGIKYIDGVATKHYLKEELVSIIESNGFNIKKIRKLEYSWSTEFENSPAWLKAPYPWDWFLLATRT